MTESTDRISAEAHEDAREEWQTPTLVRLGGAVPLTLGTVGSMPDGSVLKVS